MNDLTDLHHRLVELYIKQANNYSRPGSRTKTFQVWKEQISRDVEEQIEIMLEWLKSSPLQRPNNDAEQNELGRPEVSSCDETQDGVTHRGKV